MSRRRKVSSKETDEWTTGVTIAFPQKVDIEKMAISGSNAMSTSYRKIAEYVALSEMEHVPRTDGYYRPTPGHFGREE